MRRAITVILLLMREVCFKISVMTRNWEKFRIISLKRKVCVLENLPENEDETILLGPVRGNCF